MAWGRARPRGHGLGAKRSVKSNLQGVGDFVGQVLP